MLAHYDFITPETLAYFTPRLTQAPRDADFALAYVREHARTPSSRRACWRRCASNATSCGRSWMRCIMPMSSPGSFRPAPSCPTGVTDEAAIPALCRAA